MGKKCARCSSPNQAASRGKAAYFQRSDSGSENYRASPMFRRLSLKLKNIVTRRKKKGYSNRITGSDYRQGTKVSLTQRPAGKEKHRGCACSALNVVGGKQREITGLRERSLG